MSKWQMIIDVAKCEDCNNCVLACKDEHVGNEFPGHSASMPTHGQYWMNIASIERGSHPQIDVAYRPQPCLHCSNPPCVKAAKDGAMSIREDGAVALDPIKAKGQKQLVDACPYDAIFWNEELNLPQKCTLCAHLLDQGWTTTRCVQACPTGALQLIKREDPEMDALASSQELEVLKPNLNTKPRVYYKNHYRFNKCFITGSLAIKKGELEDCLAQVKVSLHDSSGKLLEEVQTDFFGDFKFDRLAANGDEYTIKLSKPGYRDLEKQISLEGSLSLGVIYLEPADG